MGFVITEFLRLPALPARYQHQSEQVELIRYLAAEGTTVEPGTAVVLIENRWATFEVVCEVRAKLAKNLLDSLPGVLLNRVGVGISTAGSTMTYKRKLHTLTDAKPDGDQSET